MPHLLSGVVFDFEVFEGDANLFVVGGQEVVDACGVVGVIARVSRRVERAVHGRTAAVDEVTTMTVTRHCRRARDSIVYRHFIAVFRQWPLSKCERFFSKHFVEKKTRLCDVYG